jgi:hypothetical protein
MSERIFIIDEMGDIRGLYDETIDFRKLGTLTVERASNVEFSDEQQEWQAILPDGTVIASCPSRKEAIEAEIAWLNKNRIAVGS